jgi:hypothetical protein
MQQEMRNTVVGSTVVEGMMIGGYAEGTELRLSDDVIAECVNGEVWRVINAEQELLGYINPLNLGTGAEVAAEIEDIANRDTHDRGY